MISMAYFQLPMLTCGPLSVFFQPRFLCRRVAQPFSACQNKSPVGLGHVSTGTHEGGGRPSINYPSIKIVA